MALFRCDFALFLADQPPARQGQGLLNEEAWFFVMFELISEGGKYSKPAQRPGWNASYETKNCES